MKRQFVTTHKIRQTEISALLDSSVTKTRSVKMLRTRKENSFVGVVSYKHERDYVLVY